MMSAASQTAVLSMLISVEGTDKYQLKTGQESTEGAPVLSHCSLLQNP
jgi:hypothetical protein